jgi:hypothetical protein
MLLGLLLMIIGGLLVFRNRDVASLLGREPHINQWGFMTSVIRQNVAVVGMVFFVGGLVFFVLF